MFIFSKYKINLFKDYENIKHLKNINFASNTGMNYVFNNRFKFIRNLIYFYSVFLICDQFSMYNNNNFDFRVNISLDYLLLLDNNYVFFFKNF